MKKCLYCNETFEGRLNKLYCSLYCKSAFHYIKDKNKELTRFQVVNKQLKLNRKLLLKYNQAGKATIRKEVLLKQGFDPRTITGWWKNKYGDTYLFCYEYGFLEKKENLKQKYLLVRWQSYMSSQ